MPSPSVSRCQVFTLDEEFAEAWYSIVEIDGSHEAKIGDTSFVKLRPTSHAELAGW